MYHKYAHLFSFKELRSGRRAYFYIQYCNATQKRIHYFHYVNDYDSRQGFTIFFSQLTLHFIYFVWIWVQALKACMEDNLQESDLSFQHVNLGIKQSGVTAITFKHWAISLDWSPTIFLKEYLMKILAGLIWHRKEHRILKHGFFFLSVRGLKSIYHTIFYKNLGWLMCLCYLST